jgi:hypothetical protein
MKIAIELNQNFTFVGHGAHSEVGDTFIYTVSKQFVEKRGGSNRGILTLRVVLVAAEPVATEKGWKKQGTKKWIAGKIFGR